MDMDKFEYCWNEFTGNDKSGQLNYLNKMGSKGWELVSVIQYKLYYWKRKVLDNGKHI